MLAGALKNNSGDGSGKRKQCLLLDINRSTLSYKPVGIRPRDQEMMNLLDAQYTEHPFYGVRKMKKVPELVFVVDVMREATAVHEANLKQIPVIALVDTNCDPAGVDYIIPSNDDAIRAIKLLVAKIADAALEGQAFHKEDSSTEVAMNAEASSRQGVVIRRPEIETIVADTDLLGEATLAKMGAKPAVDDVLADEEE